MFCFYYNLVDKMKFFFSNRKKFFIKKFKSKHKSIKKTVDFYIMANFAEVNLNIEKEIFKKEKLNLAIDVIHKMIKFKTKSSLLQNLSITFINFNKWKTGVLFDKRQILQEINSLQSQNVFYNIIFRSK